MIVVARLNLVQNIQSVHSGLKTKSSNRLIAFLQPKISCLAEIRSPSDTVLHSHLVGYIYYVPVVIWIWTLRGCWGRPVIRLESGCTIYVVSVTVPKSKHLLKKVLISFRNAQEKCTNVFTPPFRNISFYEGNSRLFGFITKGK